MVLYFHKLRDLGENKNQKTKTLLFVMANTKMVLQNIYVLVTLAQSYLN